jgi:SPP1 family phage portal protein
MMGVKYNTDQFGSKTFSVYTDRLYFTIKDGKVLETASNALGTVNIFEYPANNARLGAFEIVLPLLDAINNIESNRMDGIEQFVQAFVKFINCDITKEDFEALKDLGAIKVKSTDGQQADVDIVTNELNQQQTQTLKDDAYQAVLTICGMPNRNGGSSTSDTGSAVLLRDGWSLAESRAKDSELMFKRSEKEVLRLVLKLCDGLADLKLKLKDIDMKFTRRNYDNIQSKSQVLVSMLQQPKVHPLLAFTHCGLFSDPESAYTMSNEYYEEQMEKWEPVDVDESEDVNEEKNDVQTS